MRKSARGFTLVEVLVVITIIVIIATIATLSYSGLQAQSRDSKREANANIVADSLERFYDKNGEYPSVPSITSTNGSAVQAVLDIKDPSVLVMPGSPAGTTNSIASYTTGQQLLGTKLSYDASSAQSQATTLCKTRATSGCDQFKLRWRTEENTDKVINSRRSTREDGELQPPSDPSIAAAKTNSTTIVATASDAVCDAGTVKYKIVQSTSELSNPGAVLDSASWLSSNTLNVSPIISGETYYFYTKAGCFSGISGEAINDTIADTSYYNGTLQLAVSFNSTDTDATATTTSSACGSGLTKMFRIERKIDTTSALGSWTPVTTTNGGWATSANYTMTGASQSSPRKISFRYMVRCDNGASLGDPSPYSSISSVVSAPAAPAVTVSTSGSTTTWNRGTVQCPVGTTAQYQGMRKGNFRDSSSSQSAWRYTASVNLNGTPITQNTAIPGFDYSFAATASCGTPSAHVVLKSPESNESAATYTRPMPRMTFRTGRGTLNTYDWPGGTYNGTSYPSTSSTTGYALRGVVTGTEIVSGSSSRCYSDKAISRVVGWAFSNGGAWYPSYAAGDVPQVRSDEQVWTYGDTFVGFYLPNAAIKNGSLREARFLTRCKNMVTGEYSAPVSDTYPYDDRFGNLVAVNQYGRYHNLCDTTGSQGGSLKSPIWCQNGYTESGSSTGTCSRDGDSINGSSNYCWGARYDLGKVYGYTSNVKEVNDPSNLPSIDKISNGYRSGLDAKSNWGKSE